MNSFATNCPTCGYELRSVKTNSPVNELAKKIERAASVDERIELITNFYVPNTKEDMAEWAKTETVDELKGIFGQVPPAIPTE